MIVNSPVAGRTIIFTPMLRTTHRRHTGSKPFLLDFDLVTNPPFLVEFDWTLKDGSRWRYGTGLDVTPLEGVTIQNQLNALAFSQPPQPWGGIYYNWTFRALLSYKIPA
jgi:hypothetical protein